MGTKQVFEHLEANHGNLEISESSNGHPAGETWYEVWNPATLDATENVLYVGPQLWIDQEQGTVFGPMPTTVENLEKAIAFMG
jgi:hypothetical protein